MKAISRALLIPVLLLQTTVLAQTISDGYPASYPGFHRTKINNNTFFYSKTSNYSSTYNSKFVKFELTASKSGWYDLQANVIAENGKDNSFFVKVNKRFSMLWSIPVKAGPSYRSIDKKIYLKEGLNEVYFYPRENNTMVADLRAHFISSVVPHYQESFSGSAPTGMLDRSANRDGLWITNWDSLKATYRPNELQPKNTST